MKVQGDIRRISPLNKCSGKIKNVKLKNWLKNSLNTYYTKKLKKNSI
jgi:hypothetical protein